MFLLPVFTVGFKSVCLSLGGECLRPQLSFHLMYTQEHGPVQEDSPWAFSLGTMSQCFQQPLLWSFFNLSAHSRAETNICLCESHFLRWIHESGISEIELQKRGRYTLLSGMSPRPEGRTHTTYLGKEMLASRRSTCMHRLSGATW